MNQDADPPKKLVSVKFAILVVLLSIAMPFVIQGWRDLWTNFLENGKPNIIVRDIPRGIGTVPSSFSVELADYGAGLDEVVVRAHQKGHSIDLYRESFKRTKHAGFQVPLTEAQEKFQEGRITIEIKAFDRSFWSNGAVKELELRVDFRKPNLKVLTTQHNIQKGGSQLIVYEASDTNLGFHGVKVGSRTFLGFPARSLDADFAGTNVYAAFFSVGISDPEGVKVRLFAEDLVGNGTSTDFYHKILNTAIRPERIRVGEEFVSKQARALYDTNLDVMQEWAREVGQTEPQPLGKISTEQAISVFRFVNQSLRSWSELELERLLHEQRTDKLWDGPFFPAAGTVRSAFGRKLFYDYQGETIDTAIQSGYEISNSRSVRASNRGIVLFVKDVGFYGKTIALDHGLGVYTLYSWLAESKVSVGEEVEANQVIALPGVGGFSRNGSYLVHFRIGSGKAVNPREWWDKSWYYNHIVEKVKGVKRELGMAAIRNTL